MTIKHGVTSMTTGRVPTRTRLVVSFHRRNMAKDETRMTEICTTSSAVEMHMTGLKTGTWSVSTFNRSSVEKGNMTTIVPILINLTDSVLPKEDAMQDDSKLFPTS
jgi:hypothetical protein